MFRFLRRLLIGFAYAAQASERASEPPDSLTLREVFDMPPYHPFPRRVMERGGRGRTSD